MKYFLIIVVLVIAVFVYYQWLNIDQSIPKEEVSVIDDSVSTTTETKTVSSEESDQQTYRNDEWGIAFNYPNDWEVLENTFRSNSSLFNVIIQPISGNYLPRPLFISLTPASWGESTIKKYYNQDSNGKRIEISNINSYYFESFDMGLLLYAYFVPVNNTYWINVAGKKEYEETLNQILASLVITPVEVPVSD